MCVCVCLCVFVTLFSYLICLYHSNVNFLFCKVLTNLWF